MTDSFLTLPTKERAQYFAVAADKMGLPAHIIEKDFWVCWTLKRLFTLDGVGEHLTFKGGTSLSKVFAVIERFSEDIDLSIEKSLFGFTGERDPENAPSTKKRNLLLTELSSACGSYVQNQIQQKLKNAFENHLTNGFEWNLSLDLGDSDRQTLTFEYPVLHKAVGSQYVNPAVKIEFGARGEHWPAGRHTIHSYLQEQIPGSMQSDVEVRVLGIERTFWEKATILHMFAHYPAEKRVPIRQSRHYYDFFCLLNSKLCHSAKIATDILDRVAKHKSVYFRAAWARYDLAKPNSLRLIPEAQVLREMQSDYDKMASMFFAVPPSWEEIINKIEEFQNGFNQS